MAVEQELHERELTAKAMSSLYELNDNLKLSKAVQGALIALAEVSKKGVQNDEPIVGALLVFISDKGSHHLEFTGGFNPYVAYGACVDAILEVRALVDQTNAEHVVKSFVGNLESIGAQIEKDTTKPDTH